MNILKGRLAGARTLAFIAIVFGVIVLGAGSLAYAGTPLGTGDSGSPDTDPFADTDQLASDPSNSTSTLVDENDGTDQTDTVSCKKFTLDWIVTDSNGNPYDLNQDRYGNGNSCATNSGGGANFTVTKGGPYVSSGNVMSYPNLIRGCSDSSCYQPNSWPKQVSGLSPWYENGNIYTNNSGGSWDAALDMWFNKSHYVGPSNGAEILVDLNRQNRQPPEEYTRHLTNVTVDGVSYDIYLWRQRQVLAGTTYTWNFVHFWRNSTVTSINNLNLTDFMTKAETINCSNTVNVPCLQSSWYWTSADTGFEIWNGGYDSSNTNTGLTWGAVSVHS